MNLREKNIERRKMLIVEGARDMIRETGLSSISMRTLATRVNLSVPTLYNLFGNKDSIVWAVMEEAQDGMRSAISEMLRGNISSMAHLDILDCITQYMIDDKRLWAPIAVEVTRGSGRFRRDQASVKMQGVEMVAPAISKLLANRHSNLSVSAEAISVIIYSVFESEVDEWSAGLIDDRTFSDNCRLGAMIVTHSLASDKDKVFLADQIKKIEDRKAAIQSVQPDAG